MKNTKTVVTVLAIIVLLIIAWIAIYSPTQTLLPDEPKTPVMKEPVSFWSSEGKE